MAITWDKQPSSRLGTSQILQTSGTSAATTAFGAQTYQIRVATSAHSCFIKIGDGTPVATSTGDSAQIGTNITEYFTITPGQKLAAVQGDAAGTISITECS